VFGLIKCSNDIWINMAWKIFDEYVACRKNAERYHSFESCESMERIERLYKFIIATRSNDGYLIKRLLYSIATVSAFADVSNEQNDMLLDRKYESIIILQKIREALNSAYKIYPLSYDAYRDLGEKFELITNRILK
jgi:hypothetical protein